MTTITGPFPAADAKWMKLPESGIRDLSSAEQAQLEEFKRRDEEFERLQAPVPTAERLAHQASLEAHTTFRVNGELIGYHLHDAGTKFQNNADGFATAGIWEGLQGLPHAAKNDIVVDRIVENLRGKYGGALEVQHFEPGNAPTNTQLSVEMTSATSFMDTISRTHPGLLDDPEAFAILLEAQEKYG